MQNLSKLALSIFCTLVASNMFAQCPAGSPCAQRSAGYYNQDSNDDYYAPRYDNYDRSPRYRQQYYRSNPGYGQNAQGYSQDYPPDYASTTSQYQCMDNSQVADDSSSPSSMTDQTMTAPAQGNQSFRGSPNSNNAPNSQANRMMNQGNMPDSSMPTRGNPNPQGK